MRCHETKNAQATLEPNRRALVQKETRPLVAAPPLVPLPVKPAVMTSAPLPREETLVPAPPLSEQHFSIYYNDTGHTYASIMGPYLRDANAVTVEDPYIRLPHQIQNFVRFCETVLKAETIRRIHLITAFDSDEQRSEVEEKLADLAQSLLEMDIQFQLTVNPALHDREIRVDNGWTIKIGRGLDLYQKPESWSVIGAYDLGQRRCLETKVDIFR